MDPTCGHCLGSDCSGGAGFTDAKCPEHGVLARAARKAKQDNDIATLTRRSLRLLVQKCKDRQHSDPLEYRIIQRDAAEPQKFIREISGQMLARAESGIRRTRLFTIRVSEAQKPEEGLSESQRAICRHFEERKFRIVFREDWKEVYQRVFDVYVVW